MKRTIALFVAAAALSGAVLVTAALGDASSASAQAPITVTWDDVRVVQPAP